VNGLEVNRFDYYFYMILFKFLFSGFLNFKRS
jgi:hypothetical protein